MNRLQFIGQTHQGKMVSIDDIISFFDQTMAAYDIVGEVDDASVHGITNRSNSSMNLLVESPHIDELEEVVNYVNNTLHNCSSVYEKSFEVNARIDGAQVELFVRENINGKNSFV